MRFLLIATLLCLSIASCKKTENEEPELLLNTFTFGDEVYHAVRYREHYMQWEDSTGITIGFAFKNASKPPGEYQVSNYADGKDSTYVMVTFLYTKDHLRIYSSAEERSNSKIIVSYDSAGKMIIKMRKLWVTGPGDDVQISAYLKEGL